MMLCMSCDRGYFCQGRIIKLPANGTIQEAKTISNSILENNFKTMLKTKFPNLSDENIKNINIEQSITEYIDGAKKTTDIEIQLWFCFKKQPGNEEEILDYGKSIIAKAVDNYYKKN